LLGVQEVPGSNPGGPTKSLQIPLEFLVTQNICVKPYRQLARIVSGESAR
jgi:hypothetical protein